MKAVVINAFGSTDELKMMDTEKPKLKNNRMIVEMYATSVNPGDVKRRKGLFGGKLPMTVGGDVAGRVVEVGTDVKGFKEGDRIMANGTKTYAEYVSVNPDRAVVLDDAIPFEMAAAIPLAGQTAYEAIILRGKVKAGEKVLIHAGAGGVGSLAVQIAMIQGAWVASTASKSNQPFLTSLGIDQPVNYETEKLEAVLTDIDFVLDTVGGSVQSNSMNLLSPKGRLLSIVEEPDESTNPESSRSRADFFSMKPTKEGLEQLHHWMVTKQLRPFVSKVFSFTEEEIQEAHWFSEKGHVLGKLVINIKEE